MASASALPGFVFDSHRSDAARMDAGGAFLALPGVRATEAAKDLYRSCHLPPPKIVVAESEDQFRELSARAEGDPLSNPDIFAGLGVAFLLACWCAKGAAAALASAMPLMAGKLGLLGLPLLLVGVFFALFLFSLVWVLAAVGFDAGRGFLSRRKHGFWRADPTPMPMLQLLHSALLAVERPIDPWPAKVDANGGRAKLYLRFAPDGVAQPQAAAHVQSIRAAIAALDNIGPSALAALPLVLRHARALRSSVRQALLADGLVVLLPAVSPPPPAPGRAAGSDAGGGLRAALADAPLAETERLLRAFGFDAAVVALGAQAHQADATGALFEFGTAGKPLRFVRAAVAASGSAPDDRWFAAPRDAGTAKEAFRTLLREAMGKPEPKRLEGLLRAFGPDEAARTFLLWPVQSDAAGALYRIGPASGPACFVKVVDAVRNSNGTPQTHWLSVPPHIATAREGVAWTYGLGPDEYDPVVRT